MFTSKILLEGVSPNEIKDAQDQVSNWTKDELMKKLGPSQSSVIMTLVLQQDTPKNRAQILAVTKKLLASTDPVVSTYSS